MVLNELLRKLFVGERDGEPLWKIPLGEIRCEPIADPAEGVVVASLAENILRCGLLQPVLLRKREDAGASAERYEVVAGRRRIEAVRMLGRTHVQAIVVKCSAEQAGVLALSENLVRRDPHYIELAAQLVALENEGWEQDKLSAVFSMKNERIQALEKLIALPQEQLRAIRAVGLTLEDALRLADCPADFRQAILSKCAAVPSVDPSELIKQVCDTADARLTQNRKIMVSDIRAFQNTVERAIDTMRAAGFDAAVRREDGEEDYTFEVRVCKRQGEHLRAKIYEDVSRETSSVNCKPPRRFSAALNIFEALAEDECKIGADVSRETFMDGLKVSKENAEKLELCIDE